MAQRKRKRRKSPAPLPWAKLPPSTRFAKVATGDDGRKHRLHYFTRGTGPTKVLLIMGLAGTGNQWDYVMRELTEGEAHKGKYTVMTFDNRGVGFSSAKPSGRWTTKAMARDALALLDHVGWTARKSVHLAGMSMGGMISQELVLLARARFASAAFMCTHSNGIACFPPATGLLTGARAIFSWTPRARLRSGLMVLFPGAWLDTLGVDDSGTDAIPPGGRAVFTGTVANEKDHKAVAAEDAAAAGTAGTDASASTAAVPRRRLVPQLQRMGRELLRRGTKYTSVGRTGFSPDGPGRQILAVMTHHVSDQRLRTLRWPPPASLSDAARARARAEGPVAVAALAGRKDVLVRWTDTQHLARMAGARFHLLPDAPHGLYDQCPEEICAILSANFARGERMQALHELEQQQPPRARL